MNIKLENNYCLGNNFDNYSGGSQGVLSNDVFNEIFKKIHYHNKKLSSIINNRLVSKGWRKAVDQTLFQLTEDILKKRTVYCPDNIKIVDYSVLTAPSESNFGLKEIQLSCFSNYPQLLISLAKKLPGITFLGFDNVEKFSPEVFSSVLGYFSNISGLGLGSNNWITDSVIANVTSQCPNLTGLDLAHCHKITDNGVISIVKQCSGILKLGLADCKNISDEAICNIAELCPKLSVLIVPDNSKITDKSVVALKKSKNLKRLILSNCGNLTNKAICALAKANLKLEILSFDRCKNITDDALIAISKGNWRQTIKALRVGNNKITDSGIMSCMRMRACPNLIDICADGCTQLSKRVKQFLQARYSVSYNMLDFYQI